ncbi:hypothetical protein COCON_G00100800 [Conger conger]|uniref:Ig-like domain-containing protein n=1 Tax=Conger conger TaxID=82655 RepID=A0A9Q1DHT7_CONCO|nr:hypothetical protein COCON_G00100800 [Conger conger]
MKSIFSVFLLFTSAGSVYGQVKQRHERMGQSVEFPTEVKNGGNVMYLGKVIAHVISGARRPLSNEYDSRLQWNSSTGLFSLSGLKMEDKGLYKVVRNDGTQSAEEKYQLTVYVPVSKPHITITHNEYPCTLLCAVERGTDATLTWYREGEENYGSSPVHSAPHLYLPQTVEWSGTYTCEAKNSVSTERSDPLTVGDHCTGINTWGIVASVLAAVLLIALIAVVIYFQCCEQKQGETVPDTEEVQEEPWWTFWSWF